MRCDIMVRVVSIIVLSIIIPCLIYLWIIPSFFGGYKTYFFLYLFVMISTASVGFAVFPVFHYSLFVNIFIKYVFWDYLLDV
ncbi:Uncharacterised protein [Salmonella bongori]|nr:Uncharacterised protein [Salmonella bongori]